jgi:hypothetical protein
MDIFFRNIELTFSSIFPFLNQCFLYKFIQQVPMWTLSWFKLVRYWSYHSLFWLLPRLFTILASIPRCWLECRIQRFLRNWLNCLKPSLERNHRQLFIKFSHWFLRELCTIPNYWIFAQRTNFRKFACDLRVQLWPNRTHCLYTAIDFC